MLRIFGTFFLSLLSALACAQGYQVPKTEHGMPDLQGVWNFNDNTPFERPSRFGDREFLNAAERRDRIAGVNNLERARNAGEAGLSDRILEQPTDDTGAYNAFWSYFDESYINPRTSLIVYPHDGRLPPTRMGVITQRSPPPSNPCNNGGVVIADRPVRISFAAVSCDRPEDFGLASRCLAFPQTVGPYIKANSYNNNIQIIQTANHVLIRSELGNDPRIIPLDGRPFLNERIRSWTGRSRGHWEGNTLVVETRHFTDKLASVFLRDAAFGTAQNMVLTERFTRVGESALDYEFTIDDPDTFTDRITVKMNMSALNAPIYEFACHEGNYALENMLRAARIEDRKAQR
ncbi:MAG: hypothetical protein O2971_02595 [Proteobacteria bacterium]|nr:hypothetical protein [Pseudomonadota bacterium]